MYGGAYVAIMIFFGLSAGAIGKIKGSSFFLWFLIGFVLPVIGTMAALFYRWDRYEPRRRCEECNAVVHVHDQVCKRCGRDLEWPEEILLPKRPGQPSSAA
jgi:hypothetical protein